MHPITPVLSFIQRALFRSERVKQESAAVVLGLFIVWSCLRQHRSIRAFLEDQR